jgi:hypothetical protein
MRPPRLRYGSQAMPRRALLELLSAVCLMLAACGGIAGSASASASAPKSSSESSNPINDQGSSYEYRSSITAVSPSVPGLSIEVLEFADRLLLRNHTGKTVTIYGYEGEPYARVLANGTAEQNVRAPATYLNTNFYAQVVVPPIASSSAPPKWEVVDRTGEFEWHDHRIHWMSPVPPARVKRDSKRALIFNWQVPIAVGTAKGAIDGQLFWTPESSKAPLAVIILGIVIVIAGLAFVVFVRRRRARTALSGSGSGTAGLGGSAEEAW